MRHDGGGGGGPQHHRSRRRDLLLLRSRVPARVHGRPAVVPATHLTFTSPDTGARVKIRHEFSVDRHPDSVWEFFQDIPNVASCMPGAELTEEHGEGKYSGKVSVKLGAMTATFEGQCTIDPDHGTRVCQIEGKGVDRRGGSRGQVAVEYSVDDHTDAAGGSHVTVDADVKLSGAAAQFGRAGLIQEMSSRLIDEFVQCLEAKLEATTAEEAAQIQAREVKGFSLFFASLWSTIRRWFGRSGNRRQT
ncbi:MAG: hypothetical protein GEU74_00480 [Nitriliruptorales bacterium]|nr:hypothetical protein [Nitriliruptorales bacterium]